MTNSPPDDSSSHSERLMLLHPDELSLGPNAPREPTTQSALVDSVRAYGVLQPILARKTPDGLEVVAGFKRLAAAKAANLDEVPVRVYRIDDAAITAFHAASNLQGERRKVSPPSAPPNNEYKTGGPLGGLLEEELGRSNNPTPYRQILTLAGILILIVWAGLHVTRCTRERLADRSETRAQDPDTPQPTRAERSRRDRDPDTPDTQFTFDDWQRALDHIDHIELREIAGAPRVVFQNPVFSRLTTIDPNQTQRLESIVRTIMDAPPNTLITIVGHTDDDPVRPGAPFASNEELGQLRAEAVKTHLVEQAGIPAARLLTHSAGEETPPFPNTPDSSKVRNRTVSIEIGPPEIP